MIHADVDGIGRIYQLGLQLAKAGVILPDLAPAGIIQTELDFGEADPAGRPELMNTMDALNQRFGRGTIVVASAGPIGKKGNWQAVQRNLSPSFTTRWADIPVAMAN